MNDAPILLTPGPLTTATGTRQAMLHDRGSRDPDFVAIVQRVLSRLTDMVAGNGYTTIPMQGSGTFAVEAMIGTFVPPGGKLLVLVNGAYGRRIVDLSRRAGRDVVTLETPEHLPCDPCALDQVLAEDTQITHVAVVYCETTTGLLNPLQAVAETVAMRRRRLLIDAMSAFGALPLRSEETPFDAVAASANKCLEGVPGIGFVVAREAALAETEGHCHSVSLDLHAQWQRLLRQ